MSYTRWNALRATDGFSTTMSRYSQNVPSQCCSRKFETSSFLSTIETSGFCLTAGMWFISEGRVLARRRGGRDGGKNVLLPTDQQPAGGDFYRPKTNKRPPPEMGRG